MKIDGGPAYPVIGAPGASQDYQGMSLRDYFAGQALAGFTAAHDEEGTWMSDPVCAAREAYLTADAMLAEREKEK